MPKSERHSVVRVPDFKVNGLPSHGRSFLIFLLQWNLVNTVTNVTKKNGRINTVFFYKKVYGRFAVRPKKVALITR